MCACVLALRNLITVVNDGLYFLRILNPKYLNDDDDDEEGGGKRERSKHTYTGETPSAFFKQHQSREREREKRSMKTHTIYTKLYQTERTKKKVDISTKIFLSW